MKVIICQILIHFLDNVSTIHQSFKFLRNTGTRIVDKRTNYRIIACVFPKVIRLSIRISHQLLHIAHHIPWTVNINTSEMIAIVPFLHHLCLTFYASIRKNLIHFALYKTKTLTKTWGHNCFRHKIIRTRKNTFFRNFKTACNYCKLKCLIIL